MRRSLLLIIGFVAAAQTAEARSEKAVGWDMKKVFPTAVRFLRIDEHAAIVEKDAEAGYVLFEITDEGKRFRGALELVRLESAGRESVRLVVTIEDRPEYVEVGMLDRLERKLRRAYGNPPAPQPAPKEPPAKKEPAPSRNATD